MTANELPIVPVTKPLLPDLATVNRTLADIWATAWLTNMGAQHRELESRLAHFLDVPFVSLFNNGTVALQIALKSLGLPAGGEVIVTPFTFPASVHVIDACGLTPVFCDIDPVTLTIDPVRIENLITDRTCAILGVHVYGIACDVKAIDALAAKHGIKVIYDAAHAFATRVDGKPISLFGDITMHSFHATKLFHTVEGGALISPHAELQRTIYLQRNFGIANEETILLAGLNGKMNELQAGVGLAVLDMVKDEWERRRSLLEQYRTLISAMRGVTILEPQAGVTPSYQYLPVRIDPDQSGFTRDILYSRFREKNVLARKYFYPLCSDAPHYKNQPSAQASNLPVATQAAKEVLCLPFFGALTASDLARIFNVMIATYEEYHSASLPTAGLATAAMGRRG